MSRFAPTITRREFASVMAFGGAAICCRAALAGGHGEQGPLHAAAAETIITPPEGALLVGPMKPSTGVHDDLYARALVLACGSTQATIVTLDYLGLDLASCEALTTAIARATGIPAGNVLINCSHTHSAPLTVPWGPWENEAEKPYRKELPERLAGLAKQARDRVEPCRLRYGREAIQVGFNRRRLHNDRIVMAPNPQGAVVPWVDVLAIDALDGTPIAVLFSHGAHPVIVHETSTLVSADYPGFAVRSVRDGRKGGGICMFAQGCSGNVNAFPLQGGRAAAAAVGRDLGQAVLRAVRPNAAAIPTDWLRVVSETVQLPLAPPPPVEELRRMVASETNADKRQRRQELLAIVESGKRPTMAFPIRGLAVGPDLCILAMGHEPFAEYHHFVTRVSPFRHTLVFGYTNGVECYVGTEKDYLLGDRGGYETSPTGAALMFRSRLPLAPHAERQIHAGIERVLERLRTA